MYGVECNQYDGVAFFSADEHEEFTDEPLQVMFFSARMRWLPLIRYLITGSSECNTFHIGMTFDTSSEKIHGRRVRNLGIDTSRRCFTATRRRMRSGIGRRQRTLFER